MSHTRVIPVLLLDTSGRLVKTIRFGKRTYIGDPINAVKIFNKKEVDELLVLDIDASREGYSPRFDIIEDIVSEAFMPVGYGGGISNVDQMAQLYRCGLEKVVICSSAFSTPALLTSAAERFGSQSVVVSIDVKPRWCQGHRVYTHGGTRSTVLSPVHYAQQVTALGAGELIVNSVDRDGTYRGYDIPLLQKISSAVDVPVVACGGACNIEDFFQATSSGGCHAVAAGSMFVYRGPGQGVLINYPSTRLLQQNIFEKVA